MVKVSIVVTKRSRKSIATSTPVILLLSLLLGLVASYTLIWTFSKLDPISFFSTFYQTLISYTGLLEPLLFLTILGTAISIAFYGSFWNVGAEGQYVFGMLGAIYLVMFSPVSEVFLNGDSAANGVAKLLAVISGGLLGLLWSLIPGALKAYTRVSEVPVMLLMNYIAYSISDYLTAGPWKGRYTYGYIRTDMIPESSRLTVISGLEVLRYEVVIATIAVFAIAYLLIEYTRLGLEIKVLGSNPVALKSSGRNEKKTIILVSAISGFIAGLAGALRLLGYDYRLLYNIGDGKTGFYGYTAILVAWLSFKDLRFVIPSAIIVSALSSFGYRMQMFLKELLPPGVSAFAFSQIFIGTTLVVYSLARITKEYSVKLVVRE
ncbi:MAG: hypothetical protein RMI56_06875 [Sulfolobales archaeon]|nr:hypothetical protein [Sulfolobales archaeon]MDW8083495.1 hypothetical protein [Sulfolobales archaeon]